MNTRPLWSSNLERLMQDRQLDRKTFAADVSISLPTLSDWLKGNIANLKGDNLNKVCNYFSITPDEFLNSDLTVTTAMEPPLQWGFRRNTLKIREVPVTSRIPSALNRVPADDQAPEVRIGIVMYPTRSSTAYAVQVDTDEHRPRYKRREVLIIDPSVLAEPGHEVLVGLRDGTKLLRILDWSRGGLVQLSDVNEMSQPSTVEVDQVEFMHRIIGAAQADAIIEY